MQLAARNGPNVQPKSRHKTRYERSVSMPEGVSDLQSQVGKQCVSPFRTNVEVMGELTAILNNSEWAKLKLSDAEARQARQRFDVSSGQYGAGKDHSR